MYQFKNAETQMTAFVAVRTFALFYPQTCAVGPPRRRAGVHAACGQAIGIWRSGPRDALGLGIPIEAELMIRPSKREPPSQWAEYSHAGGHDGPSATTCDVTKRPKSVHPALAELGPELKQGTRAEFAIRRPRDATVAGALPLARG